MKFLAVHPSPLLYTKIYLRLEPLGLELVAQAARQAGHDVYVIDLQVEKHKDFFKTVNTWKPDVVAFSCNYLPNVPEIIDLAKWVREKSSNCFIFVGGHSASFVAKEFLEHGQGAIDCVLKGEGEAAVAQLLTAVEHDRKAIGKVPGVVTRMENSFLPYLWTIWTKSDRPGTFYGIVGNTLSGFWIPAPPSSLPGAVPGTFPFAAPGPFTEELTVR